MLASQLSVTLLSAARFSFLLRQSFSPSIMLLFLTCAFTLPIQCSRILLCNHISRSFVTAPHNVQCVSLQHDFGKTKTGGKVGWDAVIGSVCLHAGDCFLSVNTNGNETQLSTICFLLCRMWLQSCKGIFLIHMAELASRAVGIKTASCMLRTQSKPLQMSSFLTVFNAAICVTPGSGCE